MFVMAVSMELLNIMADVTTKFKVDQTVRIARILDEPPARISIGDVGKIKSVAGITHWPVQGDDVQAYYVQVDDHWDEFREDELEALVTSININEII